MSGRSQQPGGFRTILAGLDSFPTVLTARRAAYSEIIQRLGLSHTAMRDKFDEMPQSRSYLLLANDGGVAGTVRASVHARHFDWGTLPLSKYHPAEMARLAEQRIAAIQSSVLGVAPDYRNMGRFPTLALIRAILGTALAFGVDHIVTLVDPRPTKRSYWARIGWRASGSPVPHPYSVDGALLLTGSVADTLKIASGSDEFQMLTNFPAHIRNSGCFPDEV